MNTPDKCSNCDAPKSDQSNNWYVCGTLTSPSSPPSYACLTARCDALAEKLERLRHRTVEYEIDIQQACGKALGYPWYKDDQRNFPGATEKDGVCVGEHVAATIAAELANKYTALLARVKRLEEAGDGLVEFAEASRFDSPSMLHAKIGAVANWIKAKEAKP